MKRHRSEPRSGEAGRGFIGFLIAIIVVVLVVQSLRAYYVVKHRSDVIDLYTYELIEKADRLKMTVDDVRADLYKKSSELGLGIVRPEQIEVVNESKGWRVRFEYRDTVYLPGFSIPYNTRVDKSWTRF